MDAPFPFDRPTPADVISSPTTTSRSTPCLGATTLVGRAVVDCRVQHLARWGRSGLLKRTPWPLLHLVGLSIPVHDFIQVVTRYRLFTIVHNN